MAESHGAGARRHPAAHGAGPRPPDGPRSRGSAQGARGAAGRGAARVGGQLPARGDILLAEQAPERALPFLEQALAGDPKQPHAQGALGRAYALLGRPAEAVAHLQQGLSADVDGSLRYQLARAYQATGRLDEARAALEDYERFRKSRTEGDAEDRAEITPP